MDSVAGVVNHKISKEDVISKFKDDGDFDRLRVKIIRKLKENEELRNSIISSVRQSAALNRPGIEDMKPRQLSDAIHQEIGENVMNQISDGIWQIIRSGDDMKNDINESIQSVYNRLVNPQGSQCGEPSSNADAMAVNNGSIASLPNDTNGDISDSEPNEPPGFALHNLQRNNNHEGQLEGELSLDKPQDKLPTEEQKGEADRSQNVLDAGSVNLTAGPAVSTHIEQKQLCDNSDEDPDLPPGFG